METGVMMVLLREEKSMAIPAFAKANRGIIINATGKCKSCSKREAGEPRALIFS